MLAFVTVGSTRFDALIASVFKERLLSSLRKKGYTDLVVQCGNSVFEFSNAIKNGQTEKQNMAGVNVEFWKFKPSLQGDFERADLVIGHAGSGTILEVCRMGKPMIVVPNPTLLDDHQQELASALQEMEYLKSSTVVDLPDVIEVFDLSKIKPFPAFDGSRFSRIVDEAMGFS